MFIDIHTHRSEHYLTLAQQPSKASSVRLFLNIEPEDFVTAPDAASGLNLSSGVHPWRAHSFSQYELLKSVLAHPAICLIGEIGLDKKCSVAYDEQIKVFHLQLELASHLNKPVLIHQVGSMAELIAYKKKFPAIPAWIIHGFRGGKTQALQWIHHDFYLSFGPQFKPETLRACPAERLLLETDASGQTIEQQYSRAATALGCSVTALKKQIKKNLVGLFNQ